MFKTLALGLAACVIIGSAVGVTASIAKQVYEKQYNRYLEHKAEKEQQKALEAK